VAAITGSYVLSYSPFQSGSKSKRLRGVSGTGKRNLIPTDRLPTVVMNGWYVARHWAAGVGRIEPLLPAAQ